MTEPFVPPSTTDRSPRALTRSSVPINHRQVLSNVLNRIREALDLPALLQRSAGDIRQTLQVERVGIFRFYPDRDWQGELVVEDLAEGWRSALREPVQDRCFGERYASLYLDGRVNAIKDIYGAEYTPCYVEILERFQVRASIVAPLLKGRELWGLLCIHQCSGPRSWSEMEVEFVRQIAEHLGVALQHCELLDQSRIQTEQQKALAATIAKIRESLDLDTIFQTTVQEVRHLLKADRTAIFRFIPDTEHVGELVSEDVLPEWPSALHQSVQDHCFSERFAPLYQAGRVHVIADVEATDYQPCYRELLERFQIRANVVVPLLCHDRLWGLLCIHQCSGPRRWQSHEVEFISQIGEQLSVAIRQAEFLEQSAFLAKATEQQRLAECQHALTATIDQIRQSLDLETIFQTATQGTRALLHCDRVAIYQFNSEDQGQFVAESVVAGWRSLLDRQRQDADLYATIQQSGLQWLTIPPQKAEGSSLRSMQLSPEQRVYACEDIQERRIAPEILEIIETAGAHAYAVVGIYHEHTLWGLLLAFQHLGSRSWQDEDHYYLSQIGAQLGTALQQAEYLHQVKTQAERLQKAADRQHALLKTVDRIRQSLDITTIFQTTTQEVRQLLEVDRVAIYRFYPDWSGEFVADSISDGITSLNVTATPVITSLLQPQPQASKYPRNETFVPILQGEKLWGLLVAYQSTHPRCWEDEEVNLLAQVGVQLGVALQQAELLERSQRQADELNLAFQELKDSQAQLAQREKMASLGQLVAGVAHEINNPVGFITGNLSHITHYAEGMLELLTLYKQHFPSPPEEIQARANALDLEFIQQDLPNVLSSMKIGAERISEIVLSLRNFSRLDEAKMKAVDIHEGLDSTLLILRHRLKAAPHRPAIEVTRDYGSLPLVECYPAQLNQVFMNLLSNAIDALEDRCQKLADQPLRSTRLADRDAAQQRLRRFHPQLHLSTAISPDRQQVEIRIRDNGVGIPESVRSRIFDPFFTTKPIGKGTGLGLSISYQIITERHHGQLLCQSEPNKGTTFIIKVPIVKLWDR